MRVKRNFNIEDLNGYLRQGATLHDLHALTTYGTGGRGYYHRQGYTLVLPNNEVIKFQVIFTSAGYGRMTQDIKHYNGCILEKHFQYRQQVATWLNYNILKLLD